MAKIKANKAGLKKAVSSKTKVMDSEGSASGGQKLVIVESPTKAKTIRKFLGKGYVVESCFGHIRDLPKSSKEIPEKFKKEKWAQLGVNVDKHFEPIYCVPKDKTKVVTQLKKMLANSSELYLATDEDREGESISWHLSEVLKPTVPTKRMVFNEITQTAIHQALKDTRKIDMNLVKAQEARRILDRLVGYTISPLLWKKVAYGLSAGRVQSVAVKLIAEKELERLKFVKAAYWGLTQENERNSITFESKLTLYQGKRIATGKDFDPDTGKLLGKDYLVLDEEKVKKIVQSISKENTIVSEVDERPVSRKPAPPFITSTLQQEANRKMGLSSREAMQVAQKLYEQGFITYMRTDSTFMSEEALKASRNSIKEHFGKEFLPDTVRSYAAKKVKGAQEAHECIRPAGTEFQHPEGTGLSGAQLKLYEMIWMRTLASQMKDAEQKQVSVKLARGDCQFSASGMTIVFPGFLRAYVEGSDDPDKQLEDREVKLPILKTGDQIKSLELKPTEHETKPPSRFTEASLVQVMEKEGIGRPSTYASIIGTIIDRGYVRKLGNALVPTFTAMVVSKLLKNYLSAFVDLQFTSKMEESLDTIALGDLEAEEYLNSIYSGKKGLRAVVEAQGEKIDPEEAREVKFAGLEKFKLRVGKYGAYICTDRDGTEVCASIPDSETPADLTSDVANKLIDQKISGADALGKDPKTGEPIYVLNGRFGPYVQLGDITEENDKPKRVSIPPHLQGKELVLAQALSLLELPKTLGEHPELKKPVQLGIGRFGPYVVCAGDYRSIPKGEDFLSYNFDQAMTLLIQPKKGRGARAAPVKEFGPHPSTKEVMQLMNGPYGYYIKMGKTNASLPEGLSHEGLEAGKVIEIVNERLASAPAPKRTRKRA